MLRLAGTRLIDGTGADPVPDAGIEIADGLVRAVGARAPDALDLQGCTILPGLIDAHAHLGIVSMGPQFDDQMPVAELAARIFTNARSALHAGFTTVRDAGGVDGGLASAIENGLVEGPRLLPSGPVICQSGGHGDYSTPFHPHHHAGVPGLAQVSLVADGPDEVRKAARTVLRRGATQVKVCVSGGVISTTDAIDDTQFSVEELRAAVEEARARRTYVTAHAHVAAGIRNGLAAGIECFEHGTWLDEETVTEMRRAGVALVPTLAVLRMLLEEYEAMGVPEELLPRLDGVSEAMERSLKLAFDAGVPIGSGSDIFGPAQHRFGSEISLKARVLGPMAAILSATKTNARIIRRPDLGVLAPGKVADLIAVRGDPLSDPELFEDPANVVLVVKSGQIIKDAR